MRRRRRATGRGRSASSAARDWRSTWRRAALTVRLRASIHAGPAIAAAATTRPPSAAAAAQPIAERGAGSEAGASERDRTDDRRGDETDGGADDADQCRFGEREVHELGGRRAAGPQEALLAAAAVTAGRRDGCREEPGEDRAGSPRKRNSTWAYSASARVPTRASRPRLSPTLPAPASATSRLLARPTTLEYAAAGSVGNVWSMRAWIWVLTRSGRSFASGSKIRCHVAFGHDQHGVGRRLRRSRRRARRPSGTARRPTAGRPRCRR